MITFAPGGIVAISSFYDRRKRRHVVAVGTQDGEIHQIFWQSTTVGIEAATLVARVAPNSLVGLAGFVSDSDQVEHIIAGQSNGAVTELWSMPDF